jgi:hypothetical protein
MKKQLVLLVLLNISALSAFSQNVNAVLELAGYKFEAGRNNFNADLDFVVYDLLEKDTSFVNTLYGVQRNVPNPNIKLVYWEDNVLIRIFELHYSYRNGNFILQTIYVAEYAEDYDHNFIADRALPINENIIFPILIEEENRVQARYRSYNTPQKMQVGNIFYEYCWTSDLKGVSAIAISMNFR